MGVLPDEGVLWARALRGDGDAFASATARVRRESVHAVMAAAVFDGLARGEEEIFPDPMSVALSESWRTSFAKAFERENAALLQGEPQAA